MQYDERKPKILRRTIFSAFILISVVLQSLPLGLSDFSVRPFLAIPAVICISVFEREIPSALFGFFSGVLLDIASAKDGFNAVVLTVICACCSLLISHFMRNNIVTSLVLCAASAFVYEFLYCGIFYILGGGGFPLKAIFEFFVPSFVITVIFTPVFYYPVKAVCNSFKISD